MIGQSCRGQTHPKLTLEMLRGSVRGEFTGGVSEVPVIEEEI